LSDLLASTVVSAAIRFANCRNFDCIANPLNHIIVRLLNAPVDAECSGNGKSNGRNEIQD
jgi:hypothetical protein